MRIPFIIYIIMMMLASGCQTDKIMEQPDLPENPQYDVAFINMPEKFSHLPNREVEIPIEVVVHSKNGEVGRAVRVEFYESTRIGTFPNNVVITDSAGKAMSLLRLDPNRFNVCKIFVLVPGGRADAEFQVRPITLPAGIQILGIPNPIFALPDENVVLRIGVIVTDSNNVGVPDCRVRMWLSNPGGLIFGLLTDSSFSTLRAFGRQWLVVAAELDEPEFQLTDSVEINVRRLNPLEDIGSITLRAFPNFLNLSLDSIGRAELRVQVRDNRNIGIEGLIIDAVTDLGTIVATDTTDSHGTAMFGYSVWGEYGTAHITIRIRGTELEATTQIVVFPIGATLTLRAFPNFLNIPPDSLGISMLRARVLDEYHVGVAGIPVHFMTDFGTLSGITETDSVGVATAIFCNNYEAGVAHIFAAVRGTDLEATAQIVVQLRTSGEKFLFVSSRDINPFDNLIQTKPDSLATVTFRAIVRDNDNQSLSGEIIDLMTDIGRFEEDSAVTNESGYTDIIWNNNYQQGTAHPTFRIRGTEDFVQYDFRVEFVYDGAPAYIDLTIDPDTVMAGSNATITATAIVTDSSANPVTNTQVDFNAGGLGSVIAVTLTDSTGKATARISLNNIPPGQRGVMASVNGISDTATLWILSDGMPRSIGFAAERSSLPVQEEMTLSATVLDRGNLPVDPPVTVVFMALNVDPERGAHFPNGQAIDSARTDLDGIARIVLNAGDQVGGLLLKCYTWRDPETRRDTLTSGIISTVQIVAGTPAVIDIDVNDDGEDAGGGTWQIPVVARVFDRHMNPVANEIPVEFRIIPDDAGTIEAGFTGNDIGGGATLGLANTWLYYHSVKTFDTVTIVAQVQIPDGQVTGERQHLLPLQDGHLQLTIDPQNLMLDRGQPNDTFNVSVQAVLSDGHRIHVNNAPILFRTDHARLFFWRDQNGNYHHFFPEPARRYTEGGSVMVFLRGTIGDVFRDDFTLDVTVHIEASVEGYDVQADPCFLFVTRH